MIFLKFKKHKFLCKKRKSPILSRAQEAFFCWGVGVGGGEKTKTMKKS